MLSEVVRLLSPRKDGAFIDATLGDGGYAEALLEGSAPHGKLLGIERDPAMAARARERLRKFSSRCHIVEESYEGLGAIARREGFQESDGIVFDLGVASWHFDQSQRGFSFRTDEPLDMRFDPTTTQQTAADLLNYSSEEYLTQLFSEYGEEPEARKIAHAVVRRRPIFSTHRLVEIVSQAKRAHFSRIHPATRVFQALRIVVNMELRALETALPQTVSIIRMGGVLVFVSYHSLEDRLVKQFLRGQKEQGTLRPLTRKPILPSAEEVRENPRARSAKLRAAERIHR